MIIIGEKINGSIPSMAKAIAARDEGPSQRGTPSSAGPSPASWPHTLHCERSYRLIHTRQVSSILPVSCP